MPQWQIEMNERTQELADLQRQTGSDFDITNKVDFPKTIADLPFAERVKLEQEGLEPFKDMKMYDEKRMLNVKKSEEWCADSSHARTTECLTYFCSSGGPKENESMCVSWRCSKPEYYAAHKQECELHKLCSTNAKSTECMKYRCYETSDKDSEECKIWKCSYDADFRSNNLTSICMQIECKMDNFENNSDSCKEYLCGKCARNADSTLVLPAGPYAANTKCVEYFCNTCVLSSEESALYCASQNPTPNPNHTPGSNCLSDISDKNATAAEYDENGSCIIKTCKDGFTPNTDGTACEQGGYYYTLSVYSNLGYAHHNKCYATCDEEDKGDDVNEKVLYPLFNQTYCVNHANMVNFYGYDVEYFIMKDRKGQILKMNESQMQKVAEGLFEISDEGSQNNACDGHLDDIDAVILKCRYTEKDPICVSFKKIRLDD